MNPSVQFDYLDDRAAIPIVVISKPNEIASPLPFLRIISTTG